MSHSGQQTGTVESSGPVSMRSQQKLGVPGSASAVLYLELAGCVRGRNEEKETGIVVTSSLSTGNLEGM